MRIGVLGGSFNPVHYGHLNIAREAADLLRMERVYFVVSAQPPHKDRRQLIDARHRYRMVEIACEDNPLFYPSRAELDRTGPSYTIDTLRRFRDEFGPDIHFIAGQDAIEDIASWKSAAALLKTFNFTICARPGYDAEALLDVLQGVLAVKYANLNLKAIGKRDDGLVETIGVAGSASVIDFINAPPLDISSSDIRARLRAGRPVKYLVPDSVERYCKEHAVFTTGDGGDSEREARET